MSREQLEERLKNVETALGPAVLRRNGLSDEGGSDIQDKDSLQHTVMTAVRILKS